MISEEEGKRKRRRTRRYKGEGWLKQFKTGRGVPRERERQEKKGGGEGRK